ncbi:MAG: DUF3267 domain-containing protein [Anaerolineae bacterium]
MRITQLPENYREAYHLTITDSAQLLWLNILSLALLVPFVFLMFWWAGMVQDLRGANESAAALPDVLIWFLVIMVLPLHELIHGVVIQAVGHRPRYGMKLTRVGPIKLPYVLYATADGAYFTRWQFVAVAMAPAVVITLLGMLLVYLLPDALALPVAAAVVINGSGAVGDVWMTWVVLRYTPEALVKDEADSIRVYVPAPAET